MRFLTPTILAPLCAVALVSTAPAQDSAENNSESNDSAVVVQKISDYAQIADDFWTHASYDDWMITNGIATLTFGGIPEEPSAQNNLRQGSVLDLFPSPGDPENFQLFQPTTDGRGNALTFLHTAIRVGTDDQGGKALITTGHHRNDEGVTVETMYLMRENWPGALVSTTITNGTDKDFNLPVVADYVGWGAMSDFVSGSGFSNSGGVVTDCEFVFGGHQEAFVFIRPTEGLFEYQRTLAFSIIAYKKDVTLAAGESISYSRWLLTGLRNPAALNEFVLRAQQKEFGFIAGRIEEQTQMDDGRVVASGFVPNAEVRLSVIKRPDLPSSYELRPYLIGATDGNGEFRVALPPGEYLAVAATPSRVTAPPTFGIRVEKGKVSATDLQVSRPSTVVYEVFDKATGKPIPAKLSFVPLRGTTDPNFGPPGALASGNAIYTASGRGIAEVPKGDYRVVASHGIEYQSQEKRIRVAEMGSETVKFELERAFETPGWISADVGVQTSNSPHARITPEDRVITAIAEGVQWLVTADLNTVTNLRPVVERLGFGDRLLTSSGLRLGSSSERMRGSYLLFPTDLCSTGGPLDVSRLDSAETVQDAISMMRALCPEAVLVATRPIFPSVGLLSVQGYDFQTRSFPEEDILLEGVDAFQIWEGKRQLIIEQSLHAYYALLGREAPNLVPIANSFSAGSFNEEPGYPRMYIRSDETRPARLDPAELSRSIKEGRVIITNGPFINFKVNGAEIGDTITDTDGSVDVELEVFAANWANVSEVSVNANGFFLRRFVLPAGSVDPNGGRMHPKPGEDNKIAFNLTVSEDTVLNVEVRGDKGLLQDPVNPLAIPTNDPTVPRGQFSYALTGGIMIDADGDGIVTPDFDAFRSVGGATPVATPSVPEF